MTKSSKRILWIVVAVLLAICAARWSNQLMTSPPEQPADQTPRLAACPDSPNCVHTKAASEEHAIEPIALTEGDAADVLQRVRRVLTEMGGRVVTERGNYVHAEFTTPILRFIDDVEIQYDEGEKVLHFRSASRVGYSDLGLNRRRMETFRKRFTAAS